MCIVYTLAGGVLFFLIERSHEIAVRTAGVSKIQQTHGEVLDNLWTLTQLNNMTFEAYRNSALMEMEEMSRVLFEEIEERYISLENIRDNSTDEIWTMASAIFFAVTTVTTIGYGNLVPVTMPGRVICTIFGLFGIPLMLVTIADVGSFLGNLFYVSHLNDLDIAYAALLALHSESTVIISLCLIVTITNAATVALKFAVRTQNF